MGLAGACLLCASGQAQQSEPPDAPQYRALVEQALREYEAGGWPEALVLFRRAHALSPSARTLRGIGMASYELRDYAQAVASLQAALASTARPLTDAQRAEAQRVLDNALSFVARVRIAVEPTGARVLIDGKTAVPAADGVVAVNSGAREIAIEADGFETVRRTLEVEPGEARELRFSMRPLHRPQPRERAADGEPDRTGVWVAAGGAAVFLTGGVTAYLLADAEYDAIERECRRDACPAREIERRIGESPGKTYDALAIAGFALAAAGTAAAVTLYLTGTPERAGTEVELGMRFTPGRLQLEGRF